MGLAGINGGITESLGFFLTASKISDGANFTHKADFTEKKRVFRNWFFVMRTGDGNSEGEINGWLADLKTTDNTEKNVVKAEGKMGLFLENGGENLNSREVETTTDTARHSELRRRNEGLNFGENGASTFHKTGDGGTRGVGKGLLEEKSGRIGNFG